MALTLERLRNRIHSLRGKADDLEVDGHYAEAGTLRDAADQMEDEIETAISSTLAGRPWKEQPRARA